MKKSITRRISSLLVAAMLFSTVFENTWAAHIVYAYAEDKVLEEDTDKEEIKQADTSMELLDDEAFTDLLNADEGVPAGSDLSSDTLIEADAGNDTLLNEDLPVTEDVLEDDGVFEEIENDKAPADASWLRFYNTTSDNTTRKITVKSMKNDITSDFQITIPAKTNIGGVTYTTVLDNSGNGKKSLWYSQREVIRSIKIEKGVEAAANCSYLFSELRKLSSLDVSGLDTSKVTDMSYMFSEDDALTNLDLSGFDTSKVTNMAGMFRSCDTLKTVNLSGLSTNSVTDMNNMFCYDLALESLDLSGFDTSKVTNMKYMIGNCRSLKEVDLSGFNTSNVTDMYCMFYDCRSLIELDVSSFDTSKVENFAWMLGGLNSNVSTLDLRSLSVNKNLQDGKKSSMFPAGMVKLYLNKDTITHYNFNNYNNLTDIFYAGSKQEWDGLGNTKPDTVKVTYNFSGEVRKMSVTPDKGKAETSNWYDRYYNTYISKKFKKLVLLSSKGKFKEEGKKQVVVPAQTKINGEVYTTVLEGGKALWEKEQGSIESIEIGDGVETTTDCSYLFANLSGLKSIKINRLDMSNAVDMSNMFSKDYSLTKIDLSGLNTAEARKMSRMFYNCTKLENVNLAKLSTNAVWDMSYMFYYDESLLSLDLSGLDTGKVRNMSHMFENCSALKEVDLTDFNTSSVTDMSYMFRNCSALMDLDVSSFNTDNVENFSYMFSYLSPNVSTLNLLSFNIVPKSGQQPNYAGMFPSNVVDLYLSRQTVGNYNFAEFSKLANIYYKGDQTAWNNLSNAVPNRVHVSYNFTGTVEPKMKKTEDKGHAELFNWYDGYYKYYLSTKYKKLVLLSSTGKQNAEAITGTGIGMPELIVIPGQTKIDGVVYTTLLDNSGNGRSLWYEDRNIVQKVIIEDYVETTPDCSYLFSGLNNLKEVDLGGFDTSDITDMSCMFNGCNVLGSVDLSGFKTGKVRNMSYMFNNCYALKEIQTDPVKFDTSMVTSMDHMFANCTGLSDIDVSGFNTSKVTDFKYMFYRLSPDVTTLDLRSFYMSDDTARETSYMFGSSGIVKIYLSENTVREYDFTGIDSLTDIYYTGTSAQWIDRHNNPEQNLDNNKITIHFGTDPDQPSVSRCTVSFDAMGGTATKASKTVTYEKPYGELPVAERADFDFEGWFTSKVDGTQVFSTTPVTTSENHTLYARWTVYVSSITISPESVTLKMGSNMTKTLTAAVKPDNATNKNVIWTSSNPEVVTVDAYGKVTALKEGKATITASAERGFASDDCEVTVLFDEEDEKNKNMNSGKDGSCITAKKLDITRAFETVSEPNIRYYIENSAERKLASVNKKTGLLSVKKAGPVTVSLQKKDGSSWTTIKTATFYLFIPKADKLDYGKVYYEGQTTDLKDLLKDNDVLRPNSWDKSKLKSTIAEVNDKGELTVGSSTKGTGTVYAVYGTGKYARKVKISVKINHAKVDISDEFSPVTGKVRYKINDKNQKKIASVSSKGILTVKKNKSGAVTVTRQLKNGSSWVDAGEETFQVANPMTGPL